MSLTRSTQGSGWRAIRQIVSAAALAGLVAGVCLTVAQRWQVSPLIHQAEVFENAANDAREVIEQAPASASSIVEHAHEHAHQHATLSHDDHVGTHDDADWKPADGVERIFYTALVNVSLAVGFGLLLGSALYLHGGMASWRAGLVWGLAGYLVFFVAPSIGLPPQLPGAEAAPLAVRQFWWVLTVTSAAAGLALLRFAPMPFKLIGTVVLTLPYLAGAPQPAISGGSAPPELAQAFVLATSLANGFFWLVLGALTTQFYKKVRV
jgi:cobalt transporter subunit CbtA